VALQELHLAASEVRREQSREPWLHVEVIQRLFMGVQLRLLPARSLCVVPPDVVEVDDDEIGTSKIESS
jgi:hypothetical protein